MFGLKKKKHQNILYNKLVEAIEGQVPDKWEKNMLHSMIRQTRFKAVDELASKKGWKTAGENVNHVLIDPRGRKYIGPATIYVPKDTLSRLKGLESRDPRVKKAAEEALHTVAHEFAHDYFKAINYEARLTRYLRDNPKVVERYMSRFLNSSGKFKGNSAREKAKELVGNNPLYWSNYVAHTAHEGGADMMGAEAVARIAEKRHANAEDLERLTAYRPFTVKEFIRVREGEKLKGRKPRKPSRLSRLARNIEYGSFNFMKKMGRYDSFSHPSKARAPPSSLLKKVAGRANKRRVA